MNRVERLATPWLRTVAERQFPALGVPVLPVDADVTVRNGHPAGGRNAFIVSSVRRGELRVRCVLDVAWYDAVWRRHRALIDEQFILDVDHGVATYVEWTEADTVMGRYPFATACHKLIETTKGKAHLGAKVLGPNHDRGMEYLLDSRRIGNEQS